MPTTCVLIHMNNTNLQVVENDPGHLGRLLQLILGVAINCDSKTDHIQALLTMEQDVQRVVMMAIQVLEPGGHFDRGRRRTSKTLPEAQWTQGIEFIM